MDIILDTAKEAHERGLMKISPDYNIRKIESEEYEPSYTYIEGRGGIIAFIPPSNYKPPINSIEDSIREAMLLPVRGLILEVGKKLIEDSSTNPLHRKEVIDDVLGKISVYVNESLMMLSKATGSFGILPESSTEKEEGYVFFGGDVIKSVTQPTTILFGRESENSYVGVIYVIFKEGDRLTKEYTRLTVVRMHWV